MFCFVYRSWLELSITRKLCNGMIGMLVCMLEVNLAFYLYFMFQFTIRTWILLITLNLINDSRLLSVNYFLAV